MKKTNRFLALFLAFLMLTASAVFFTASAEGEPYVIVPKLYYENGDAVLRAEVYLSAGTKGVSGNVSFKFDTELLGVASAEKSVAGVVTPTKGITVVDAGKTYGCTDEMFINETDGVIAFPWVVDLQDSKGSVGNDDENTLIATATFNIVLSATSFEEYVEFMENFNMAPISTTEASDVENIKMFVGKPSLLLTTDNYVTKEGVATGSLVRLGGVTGTKGNKSATVKWTADDEYDTVYILAYDKDGKMVASRECLMSDKKSQFTGLNNGEKYTFFVFAENSTTNETTAVSKPLYVTPSKSGSGSSSSAGARNYDVIFDLGNGETEKITVTAGSRLGGYDLPEAVAPAGKKFIGWSEDGKTVINTSTFRVYAATKLSPIFEDTDEPVNEYHNAYIGGYDDGTVKPNNKITRAEAAAIIAKVSADFDAKAVYDSDFADVKNTLWYADFIGFCAEKKIITGYPDGTFRPDENITRAEFTVMITRYLGLKASGKKAFSDTGDHWADGYINALKNAKIVDGYTDGTYKPENDITRAEAVKMVNRAADRVPSKDKLDAYVEDEGIPFTDLKKDFWGFYDVMEATVTHVVSEYHE